MALLEQPAPISRHPSGVWGLRFDGISASYSGLPLFSDLSLEVPRGRWTVLLGRSGIGKSTLMRIAAGLQTPEHGACVAISQGRDAPVAGLVAHMAQSPALLPWTRIRDNVVIGARLRGDEVDHARASSLLAAVGMASRANAPPGELSGGERQRIALARTLYEDRPIVLMDEPFAGLDALTREDMGTLAKYLLRDRTVFFITHDPREAIRLADDVIVLAGRPARIAASIAPPTDPDGPAAHDALARIRAALGRSGE